LLALALPFSAPALAQTAPATPGNTIDDRVRQQIRLPSETEREEAMLTGDTDIILTRPRPLFTLSGSGSVNTTSNAYLAPDDRVADGFGQAQIDLQIGTRIAGKVDVFAGISLLGARYFDETSLGYSALSAVVGARTRFGPVDLIALYQPTLVYDLDFGDRQLTTHRFRATASLPQHFGRVTVEPGIAVERTIADPDDYSAWSGQAGLTVSAPLSPALPLIGYVSVQYERREFDSYFFDIVGVDRKDDRLGVNVGLVWRPAPWADIRASYSFQRNWSTSDVNRYRAHSGGLSMAASMRF
jgi:hypothetical protein